MSVCGNLLCDKLECSDMIGVFIGESASDVLRNFDFRSSKMSSSKFCMSLYLNKRHESRDIHLLLYCMYLNRNLV